MKSYLSFSFLQVSSSDHRQILLAFKSFRSLLVRKKKEKIVDRILIYLMYANAVLLWLNK